eukprot:CAMPEP_0180508342 /NCGR_PEP_ID=MMETSP1036_2-20121128/49115_1 /TAXON_ID=632150 /ORGANISM="Azadinium spinosum, Strain 3D9" /LENGTH=212 /DNA_ID=CAMNT_0022518631 /DNA_START=403 /DNA_END=1042 /DNA_ORIENTATION=-
MRGVPTSEHSSSSGAVAKSASCASSFRRERRTTSQSLAFCFRSAASFALSYRATMPCIIPKDGIICLRNPESPWINKATVSLAAINTSGRSTCLSRAWRSTLGPPYFATDFLFLSEFKHMAPSAIAPDTCTAGSRLNFEIEASVMEYLRGRISAALIPLQDKPRQRVLNAAPHEHEDAFPVNMTGIAPAACTCPVLPCCALQIASTATKPLC